MGYAGTDVAHEAAEASQEISVQCRKCPTLESEHILTITRHQRVGVVKESDHNKPVVEPVHKIRE